MTQDKFSIFIPIEIEKSGKTGEDRYSDMKFKGIASNPNLGDDKQGQWLDPAGFDLNQFIKEGNINYHHLWKNSPLAIIGEPTSARITKGNELYVEGRLYKDSAIAREVYDLAEILEKNSTTRRLGFSIEGLPLATDPKNENRILKAKITNLAITPAPICPGTKMELIKGGFEDLQFANQDQSEFIIDIVQDGYRYTVDKNLTISKSEIDTLEKGGEGSRGGKIIGHTKSGKPVYEKQSAHLYSDFSTEDHTDAESIHVKRAHKHADKSKLSGGGATSATHDNLHEYHRNMSLEHQKERFGFKKAMMAGEMTGTETHNQSLTQEPLKEESVLGAEKKKKKKENGEEVKEISKGDCFTRLISQFNLDNDSCKRVWMLAASIESTSV